jgi:enamine deaminase RidA (YjgF/YER057c/UK114 family)
VNNDEPFESRARVPSDRPWRAGYSRAIRVGDIIEVSGTVASDASGVPMFPTDMAAQVTRCLETIGEALERLGSSHADVVRTRLFLTDISRWREAAAAHHQVFGDILPACSFIGISELLHPDFLVEIEATAIASRRSDRVDRSAS